jgi:hypothetical protein
MAWREILGKSLMHLADHAALFYTHTKDISQKEWQHDPQ